jgi:hypothetical protein
VTRTLCGLFLLFAVGCSSSSSPTAPTPPPTQSGPTVVNLQWQVVAASCAPVSAPPSPPPFSTATIVRRSETQITASWPSESGTRPGTLYANFIFENNAWGLCSWDIADV